MVKEPSPIADTGAPAARQAGNVDRILGQRLRQARQMAKLTQQALADRCSLSFQQIQKYENGTNRISASRLHQLAQAMNLDLIDLMGRTAEADAKKTPHPRQELERKLVHLCKELDVEALSHLIFIAERMGATSTPPMAQVTAVR